MEVIPIIILFGSALASFACFQFYRPYLYALANFPGAFLMFAAALTGSMWIYEHVSRVFGEPHPYGLMPGMQWDPMPLEVVGGYIGMTLAWYASCLGVRAWHLRCRRLASS